MEHTYPELFHIWLCIITDQIQGVKRGKKKAPKFDHHFSGRKIPEAFFLVGMSRNVLFSLRNFF